jgi:hypothetical protein
LDYGQILILQYIIVIPTAIFSLFFMPRRGRLAVPLENLRRNSALVSLLPCGPISIVLVLLGAGIYYLVVQSQISKEESLQKRIAPTKTTGAGANPFGHSSPQRTTSAASGNPFSADAGPRPQGERNTNDPNPFS